MKCRILDDLSEAIWHKLLLFHFFLAGILPTKVSRDISSSKCKRTSLATMEHGDTMAALFSCRYYWILQCSWSKVFITNNMQRAFTRAFLRSLVQNLSQLFLCYGRLHFLRRNILHVYYIILYIILYLHSILV